MAFQPDWKPSRTARKLAERKDRLDRKAREAVEKKKVRLRDRRCRFPLCSCGRYKFPLEVSHQEHKGMGGNPAGERSSADRMIYLCIHRHQHGAISRHKGTMRARPLTADGTKGPVAWDVDLETLRQRAGRLMITRTAVARDGWLEVARETRVQVLEPLLPWQRSILALLAEMEL